jgi:hypothetical protein
LQYFAVLANKKTLNVELINMLVKPLIEMSTEIPYFAAICARRRIEITRKQFVESIKNAGQNEFNLNTFRLCLNFYQELWIGRCLSSKWCKILLLSQKVAAGLLQRRCVSCDCGPWYFHVPILDIQLWLLWYYWCANIWCVAQ